MAAYSHFESPGKFNPGTLYFADNTVDPYPYATAIKNKPVSYQGGMQSAGRMRQRPIDFLKDVLGLFGFSSPKHPGKNRPEPIGNNGAAMQQALYNSPSWLITQ